MIIGITADGHGAHLKKSRHAAKTVRNHNGIVMSLSGSQIFKHLHAAKFPETAAQKPSVGTFVGMPFHNSA
jgi:hypothetical protein